MNDRSKQGSAIALLQELGLKAYEAKSYVALVRLSGGTAKDISEVSEVPRTRVYDAVSSLESRGLVEIQHSNPRQFRAVPIDEAVETLKAQFDARGESLRAALSDLDPVPEADPADATHEVWSLSGQKAIASRTRQLIDEADGELLVVLGHGSAFTPALVEPLEAAVQRGVGLTIGTVSESLRDEVETVFPETSVFVSGLEWLGTSAQEQDDTSIGRLVLVDRETILVSSITEIQPDGVENEHAVFGRGFENGLVTIVRRLMATGLLPENGSV